MPSRKQLRLAAYDYGSAGAYFVTTCTYERACILSRVVDDRTVLTHVGLTAARCWFGLPRHLAAVSLDVFVIMPNHIHGVLWLAQTEQASPVRLGTVVGAFKASSSRQTGRRLWQRGFHERVIRSESELDALRRYVVDNPARWALDTENPRARV